MTVKALSDAVRKKQLGQYFTNQRVGRLLAALSDAGSAQSIIDPMVGSADLLRSCLSAGAKPKKLVGIELDPIALDRARSALDGVDGTELILGDAFSMQLPPTQFDLVITNPPYIRYQSRSEVDGIRVPTSADVRAGLNRAIAARPGFSDNDRSLWLRVARAYPGTSDIAVPAWILSASLVREGGLLAIVAPQAWLSRNYAQAIRTLIDKAFDIEVIVEDGDVSWFDDAQVRTQLVVARRRPLAASGARRKTVMARATRELDTNGDLRGALDSEVAVADALRSVASSRTVEVTTGLTAHVERALPRSATNQGVEVPARVATVFGLVPGDILVRTMESYGWRTGQGLRSGANDFFYVSDVEGVIRPAARWGIDSLPIPPTCLLPAVRRQNEIGSQVAVHKEMLTSRVLDLRGWVTASDMKKMSSGNARVLPDCVSKWIAQVASTPFSAKDPAKLFPDLVAVATNSRTDQSGRPVSFWYQLPAPAPRHRPTLFVGRVCGGRPQTFLNSSDAIVDANFSGMWPIDADALPIEAMLALLSSNWAWANLESRCTVLGGGALKIEATDLRSLALPDLSKAAVSRLTELGRLLVDGPKEGIASSIDEVVIGSLVPGEAVTDHAIALRTLAERSLRHRSRVKSPISTLP